MPHKKFSPEYPIRITARHVTGCSEWDVYTDFDDAERRAKELIRALEADANHFEKTGRID